MLDLFLYLACCYVMRTHLRYAFRRLHFVWKKLLVSLGA